MTKSLPDILTVKQAAAFLQADRKRIYDLIHSKQLIALRVGRGFRISKNKLLALVEQG